MSCASTIAEVFERYEQANLSSADFNKHSGHQPHPLHASQSVSVIAIVTEQTGLQNRVGGQITSLDGKTPYDAFVATTQGTDSVTRSWEKLGAAVAKLRPLRPLRPLRAPRHGARMPGIVAKNDWRCRKERLAMDG
jgi:hypothetical protein